MSIYKEAPIELLVELYYAIEKYIQQGKLSKAMYFELDFIRQIILEKQKEEGENSSVQIEKLDCNNFTITSNQFLMYLDRK